MVEFTLFEPELKIVFMIAVSAAVFLAYRAIYQIIKQSVKEYRDSLELFEPEKKWNSFEGHGKGRK